MEHPTPSESNNHQRKLAHSWITVLLKARQRHFHHVPSRSSFTIPFSGSMGRPTLTGSITDSSPTTTKSSPSSIGRRCLGDTPSVLSRPQLLEHPLHEWWSCDAQPAAAGTRNHRTTIGGVPQGPEPAGRLSHSSGGIPEWIEIPAPEREAERSSPAETRGDAHKQYSEDRNAMESTLSLSTSEAPPHFLSAWGGMITSHVLEDWSGEAKLIAAGGDREQPSEEEERDPSASKSNCSFGRVSNVNGSGEPGRHAKSSGCRRSIRSVAPTPRGRVLDSGMACSCHAIGATAASHKECQW